MTDTEIFRSEARIVKLREKLAAERKHLGTLLRPPVIPDEPADDLVTFDCYYSDSVKVYKYAARRAPLDVLGNRWFTTGFTCPEQGYSWAELIEWLRDPEKRVRNFEARGRGGNLTIRLY